ncbi:hypothetical protein COV18_02965 [Candidatus Woesearchaeota archaeon CG10_big_fil_rev_8_21_14_0_10_37_12]|nr:MAG: hypothetical protein COV18_02965 [Candidatus Woesearchaeota archaeon CG10_big_fil_rev_8_21_14_0_10_37_12]
MAGIVFPFDVEELFEKFVKHKAFPANDFKKQAILLKLLDNFEDEKVYSETEVTSILEKYYDDPILLRRELINFGICVEILTRELTGLLRELLQQKI